MKIFNIKQGYVIA